MSSVAYPQLSTSASAPTLTKPMHWKGNWSSSTAYAAGDVVSYLDPTNNHLPSPYNASTSIPAGTAPPGSGWVAMGPQSGVTGTGLLSGLAWVNVADYGAVADCSGIALASGTDQTAAFMAALTVLYANGGGTLYIPANYNKGYLITNQLVVPDSTSTGVDTQYHQPTYRIVGPGRYRGGGGFYYGAFLVMTYQDPTIDHIFPANAKIVTRGGGTLEIANITFMVGGTAADYTPCLLTTNTVLYVHHCGFGGTTSLTGTSDVGTFNTTFWLNLGPATDCIVLGDPNAAEAAVDEGFSGYGSVISDCRANTIRRFVLTRGAANAITVSANQLDDGCGNISTPFGPLIDLEGGSNITVRDNSIGQTGAASGILCATGGITLSGNAWWDADAGSVQLKQDIPPATVVYSPGAVVAAGTTLMTTGYLPANTPITVESNPFATVASSVAAQAGLTMTLNSDPQGLLPSLPYGSYIRTWEVDANGNPIPGAQEIFRMGTVTGASDPRTVTIDLSGAFYNHLPHSAGTQVQLFPVTVVQPVTQQATTITVNSNAGGMLTTGTMIKLTDVSSAGLSNTEPPPRGSIQELPAYAEWFLVQSVTFNSTTNTYTVTLDRKALFNHTTGAPLSTTLASAASSGATQLNVASSASYMVGMQVSYGSTKTNNLQTFTITGIPDSTHLNISPAVGTTIASGSTITGNLPTTFLELWEPAVTTSGEPFVGVTSPVTMGGAAHLNNTIRAKGDHVTMASIPPGLKVGAPLCLQDTTTPVSSLTQNYQPTNLVYQGGNEWFTVRSIDTAHATVYLDHQTIGGYPSTGAQVLFGPFKNTLSAALTQQHVTNQRVWIAGIHLAQWLPRGADNPWLRYCAGYDQTAERFQVFSWTPTAQGTVETAGTVVGAANVSVNSSATIANGSIITIGSTFGGQDIVRVTGVTGTSPDWQLTVSVTSTGNTGMRYVHSVGDPVYLGPSYTVFTTPLTRRQSGFARVFVYNSVVFGPGAANNVLDAIGGILPPNGVYDPNLLNPGYSVSPNPRSMPSGNLILSAGPQQGQLSNLPSFAVAAGGLALPTGYQGPPNDTWFYGGAEMAVPDGAVAADLVAQTVYSRFGGLWRPIGNVTNDTLALSGPSSGNALQVCGPSAFQGNLALAGLTPPAIPWLADAGAGNVDAGQHSWAITYLSANGESLLGPALTYDTTSVAAGARQLTLTIPQGPVGTTGINVYRTKVGTTTPYFKLPGMPITANIAGSGTVSYLDNTADASLTTTSPPAVDSSPGSLSIGASVLRPLAPASGSTAALQLNGQLAMTGPALAVVSKSANYTATAADCVILATANNLTITLPAPASVPSGRMYTITNAGSAVLATTVAAASGTVNGGASATVSGAWATMRFITDGTNWYTA